MKETELKNLLPPPVYTEYPKWRYQEGQDPRLVNTEAEEAALSGKWYDLPDFTDVTVDLADAFNTGLPSGYVPIEYPKWKYAPNKDAVLVNDEAEEAALPGQWFDSPDCKEVEAKPTKAEFDAIKKAEKEAAKKAEAEEAAKKAEAEDDKDGDTEGNVNPPVKPKKPVSKKNDADDLL